VLSIDIRLQALVEELFGDRRGALVAIDPRNGEVLAFVSKPTFDPNLFVDGIDVESWRELNESIDKPLLNRALRGTYPPGSHLQALHGDGGAEQRQAQRHTVIHDGGSFQFGNHTFRSHGDRGLGPVDMPLHRQVEQRLLLLAGQRDGRGPDARAAQALRLRRQDRHRPRRRGHRRAAVHRLEARATTRSPSSSAGTPARPSRWASARATTTSPCCSWPAPPPRWSRAASASSRAWCARSRTWSPAPAPAVASDALEPLPLKPEHVALIKKALHGVTQEGTSTRVFAGAPYASGGKTGTAQAVGIRQNEKYNAAKLEEHQRDHSLYIAMAPIEAPTVALAVIVENAGFGAEAAAPIARRVFDYLLLGQYPSEEDMAPRGPGQVSAPIGTPRADDVPLPGCPAAGGA
jgi:penicillin-binding protein 2